jgi:BirA family biotin operon repressor/biotin-[acetyl-CoA-carboxylase] ligase
MRIFLSTNDNVGAVDTGKANRYGNWLVERVSETGSTNADLLKAAENGAPNRSVLVTDHQTAGRGRLGRVWEAPPGTNLLVSTLFRDVTDHAHRLTQHLGLAAAFVLRDSFGIDAGLKWPNDVVVSLGGDDVKIAGILAQSTVSSTAGVHVVVGMGLNVGWAPPADVAIATCVNNVKAPGSANLTPFDILQLILRRFDEIEGLSPSESFGAYRASLRTLGKNVKCDMPDGTHITGRAVDIDTNGRLQVLDECAITHHIDTADVVHLRNVQ